MSWIAFIGPIASGKSTITKKLAELSGYTLIEEPVANNPFLQKFYKNKRKYGFLSQMSFYSELFLQWDNMQEAGEPNVIADSCLFSNLVFTEMMGHNPADLSITPGQHAMCHYVAEEHIRHLKAPDKYVVLKIKQEYAEQRCMKRNREIEADQAAYLDFHYKNYYTTLDLIFQQYSIPKSKILELSITRSVLDDSEYLTELAEKIGLIYE